MLYAFSVNGKMLLFCGGISPKDYETVENTAAAVFAQANETNLNLGISKLMDSLNSVGISVKPVRIEKVFRIKSDNRISNQ